MAKISSSDLLEAFKEMTLLELSEFVKQFEDTFDVKAAAPVALAAHDHRRRPKRRGPSRPSSRTSSTSSSKPQARRKSKSSRKLT